MNSGSIHPCLNGYNSQQWTLKIFNKFLVSYLSSQMFSVFKGNKRDNWPKMNLPMSVIQQQSLDKKWTFPLRISSVNVAKSGGNHGFGSEKTADFVAFFEEILNGKLLFVQWMSVKLLTRSLKIIMFLRRKKIPLLVLNFGMSYGQTNLNVRT